MVISSSNFLRGAKNRYHPRSYKRILCVFPRYVPSFGTFQYAYPLIPGVRAFMPPQGILTVANYLPREWEVRFVDENIQPAKEADFLWADAVFISGMHVQREEICSINARAHRYGKVTVLGGPSVSACPEYYPEVDILHIGELGDGTDALIAYLDSSLHRPPQQVRFTTTRRLPLTEFPSPAYHKAPMRRYFLGSLQFSSGCPFQCEFCDIPELYGRNPRLKSPEQVLQELETMIASGGPGAVYFVDDNFIANPRATRHLLQHLIEWQKKRGYPVEFAGEATLNIAQFPDILEKMREAYFTTLFCGIETPEVQALQAIHKEQNLRLPILEAVRILNSYGIEVVSGIILGLDTDTLETPDHIIRFIHQSQIPMLTINLLYALPKTPLYRRLAREDRLIEDPYRASNVKFLLPYETVLGMWRRIIAEVYHPDRLLQRFAYQTRNTYPNRITPPRHVRLSQVLFGLRILARVLLKVGFASSYRRSFWKIAGPLLREGRIEEVIHIGLVSYHLLRFAQDCLDGSAEACFYADPSRSAFSIVGQSR